MQKFLMRAAFVAALGVVLGLTSAAHAADKYVPPIVQDVMDPAKKNPWTGVYVEGGLGLSSGTLDLSMPEEGGVSLGDKSWAGHIGVGVDWAVPDSPIVIGVLARVEKSDVGYGAGLVDLGSAVADAKTSWMLGGRVGYAPGPWMIYALAGYRWSKLDAVVYDIEDDPVGKEDINTSAIVLGAGVEVLLGRGWFAGLEYTAAMDAGETFGIDDGGDETPLKVDATEHTGKVRVGFKF